ncbi:MAG: alpha/beta hydrolase [Firmicutes bacterium]|nr:alpha/beta hydrolase [Bacillota bacterium]
MNGTIGTAKTDSFSMDYFKFGHGEKALVILPGLSVQSVMGFAEAVEEAYQVLAEDHTVYLLERRKELPEAYSIHEMAEDTVKAISALELEHIYLFGASQGGMIALDIAINHPELVEKLVLGSTSATLNGEQFKTIDKWIDLARAGDSEGLYLSFGEKVYPEAVYEQSKGLLIEAAKTVTEEDMARFVILAEGMRGLDLTGDLGKVGCPALVLGSKDDQVVGAEASQKLADQLNDCELYMYEGYGHAAYDTAPDYKERILKFLKKE